VAFASLRWRRVSDRSARIVGRPSPKWGEIDPVTGNRRTGDRWMWGTLRPISICGPGDLDRLLELADSTDPVPAIGGSQLRGDRLSRR
jgi:hypothetical protein